VSTTNEVTPQPERPTDEWVTGDEPMTGPQQSYLQTLAREAGEDPKSELTKAQASEEIERLQQVTGRGA
jgi:3-methyladenine DNA glycosylase/8-oxoguanine DNA glycosylase